MAKRKPRSVNKTTLLVMGEGEHDKAFLSHMKGIYHERRSGSKITLDFSSGGSPHDIIKDTVKKSRHVGYDQKFILMDSDVPVNQQDIKAAKDSGITILYSEPLCLEGMLLNVLGQNTPHTAQKCKNAKVHYIRNCLIILLYQRAMSLYLQNLYLIKVFMPRLNSFAHY